MQQNAIMTHNGTTEQCWQLGAYRCCQKFNHYVGEPA